MNFNWKHGAGSLALSVAMLSVSAGAQVAPAGKPVKPPAEVVQPAPSVDIETGQLLIKDKPPSAQKTSARQSPVDDAAAPGSTEKGIKDPGVKSCGSCGLTSGKVAAPPPADGGGTPPSAEWETGQLLIKDKPKLSSAAKNELCGLPYTAKCVTNATAKKGSNTGLLLGITAGAAALAAVLASGNNDDRPTSP